MSGQQSALGGGKQRRLATWAESVGLDNHRACWLARHGVVLESRASGTNIDHILTGGDPSAFQVVGGWNDRSSIWSGEVADHFPVVIELGVVGGRGIKGLVCPTARQVDMPGLDLNLTGPNERRKFGQILEQHIAGDRPGWDAHLRLEPGELLLHLTAVSKAASARVTGRRRKAGRGRRKDGWSPVYMAHKIHAAALTEIARHLRGEAGRRRWCDLGDIITGIRSLICKWESDVRSLTFKEGQMLSPEDIIAVLGCTDRPPSWWMTAEITRFTAGALVMEERGNVLRLLHGRWRTEQRLRINEAVARRTRSFEEGRLGSVIRSVLNSERKFYSMQSIRTAEGTLQTDAYVIHRLITAHFEAWFQEDKGSGTYAHQHDMETWTSWENFSDLHNRLGIPVDLLRRLWHAIERVPAKKDLAVSLEEALGVPPSYEDFCRLIGKLNTSSAGGMSGLTYSMIKAWPEAFKAAAYSALAAIWESGVPPEYWKFKWIVPLPKDSGEVKISRLRPIVLLEALRKIWSRLITYKLEGSLQAFEVLSKAQHGGVRGQGTDSAHLQFINLMEQALEEKQKLYVCTWDMIKAYDTVSDQVKRFVLRRLAVPEKVIAWILELDRDSVSVVRSPVALVRFRRKGYKGVDHRCSKYGSVGFTPILGVGQGDVTSPILWRCLIDILLRALEPFDSVDLANWARITTAQGKMVGQDQCFVDDLLSTASSVEGMQAKANIVSAFCLIFGLRLAPDKMRRLVANGGRGNRFPIRLHPGHWNEAVFLSPYHGGEIKNLGVWYDQTYSGRTDFEGAFGKLTLGLTAVQRVRGSKDMKLRVVASSVLPSIVYSVKFLALSLKDCRQLDVRLSAFYRKVCSELHGFPNALLYSPYGYNLACLTDMVQGEKWGCLRRAQGGDTFTAVAAANILSRHAREADSRGVSHGTWVGGIAEWGAEGAMQLVVKQRREVSSGACLWGTSRQMVDDAAAMGVVHIADMVRWDADRLVWGSIQGLDLFRRREIEAMRVPDAGVCIRIGQVWWSSTWGASQGGATSAPHMVVRLDRVAMRVYGVPVALTWTSQSSGGDPVLALQPGDLQAQTRWEWQEFLPGANSRRYIIGVPRLTQGTSTHPVWAVWDVPSPQWLEREDRPVWLRAMLAWFQVPSGVYQPVPGDIFSDGSWTRDGRVRGVLHPGAGFGTGAVLLRTGRYSSLAIRICHVEGVGAAAAHTVEFLAVAAAMQLSAALAEDGLGHPQVHTDCQSVLDKIKGIHGGLRRATASHLAILECISRLKGAGQRSPSKVKAHPERRSRDDSAWTEAEWGIFLADLVAGTSGHCLEARGHTIHVWDTEAADVHEGLLQFGQWSWKEISSGSSSVDNIQSIIRQKRCAEYVRVRDHIWRQKRECEPYWTKGSPSLMALIGEFPIRSGGTRGIHKLGKRIRYLWDKNWHGGNRGKGTPHSTGIAGLGECDFCGEPDSQDHWLLRCPGFDADYLRERVDHKLTDISIRGAKAEVRWVARFFRTQLFAEQARRLWTGNLTGAMAEDIFGYVQSRMTQMELLQVHKGIVQCGRLLLKGGLEVWQLRMERRAEKLASGTLPVLCSVDDIVASRQRRLKRKLASLPETSAQLYSDGTPIVDRSVRLSMDKVQTRLGVEAMINRFAMQQDNVWA